MFSVDIPYKGLVFSTCFPWKIGIVGFMAYPDMTAGKGDIVGNIEAIVEDSFFDGIEVCGLTEERWNAARPSIGSKTVARGMQPDLLSGKINLNSTNSDDRRKAIELVKKEIDLTAARGIRRLAVCSGPDPGPEKRSEERDLLAESLEEICKHASEKGVEIFLENFDRDWDRRLLIGPTAESADVVRKVRRRCPNLSMMWDLSHAPLLNETREVLDAARDVLGHIHIGCAKKVGDKYLDTHPIFYREGAVNRVEEVALLLKKLLEVKYDGMVSFEVKPEEGQTSEGIITTSKGVLFSAYRIVVSELLGS